MKLIRQTTLRFQQGETSDKVYELDIVETAGEYLVNYRYGKYGANLREGCKTKAPIIQIGMKRAHLDQNHQGDDIKHLLTQPGALIEKLEAYGEKGKGGRCRWGLLKN